MAKKKQTPDISPKVHNEIKGYDIKINEFGQITSSLNVDDINKFLDDNVEDKKLKEKQDKENNDV
ncbi:MAG: hypothetical protein ACI94Y_000584 [Maribacter sp.]|jgi:hypothetical protein